MNLEQKVMLIVFIANTMCVVVFLIQKLIEQEEKTRSFWIKAIVMLLCPVVGPLFFCFGYLFNRLLFWHSVDLADVVFSKERVRTNVRADEERGRNIVSLEEAIAVSDKGSLRNLMLNVVRGDIQKSLASISLALNSEDSETSHYAASVLQDELNEFRVTVQKIYIEIKRGGKEQSDYALMLIEYMDQVLKQKVFTGMEQVSFVRMMEEVGEILYYKEKERMNSMHFEYICMRLLEVQEYALCRKWCERSREEYPNTLSSYTCFLKLYFTCQERENFFEVLNELKRSNIIIDNETLELIRIFS